MNPRILLSLLVGIALVVISAAGRLAPHPPNFIPVAAAALFAGYFFKQRFVSLTIPLTALGISDLVIGGYDWRIMCVVYAALALPVALRPLVRTVSVRRVAGCSLIGSIVFYLASNAAVWAFSPMYESTVGGLVACYVAALPFLVYTMVGDLFWCSVFFGTYSACKSESGQRVRWRITAGLPSRRGATPY
jgi:hypothetical protein